MHNYSFKTKKESFFLDDVEEIRLRGNLFSFFPDVTKLEIKKLVSQDKLEFNGIVVKAKDFPDISFIRLFNCDVPSGQFFAMGRKLSFTMIDAKTMAVGIPIP